MQNDKSKLTDISTDTSNYPTIGSIWQHYKGNQYKIIEIARHSETLELLVIYQALYNSEQFGNNAIWARPLSMWQEIVEYNGKKLSRFVKVNS